MQIFKKALIYEHKSYQIVILKQDERQAWQSIDLKFIVGVVDYHKLVISRKDKQILHAILSLTKTAHFVVLSVVNKAEFNAKIQIKSLKLKFNHKNANLKPKP